MQKMKKLVAFLLVLVMVVSLLPVVSFAADEPGEPDNPKDVIGLEVDKKYDSSTGYLTMEAYVTGATYTVTTSVPTDILLVLDTTTSMEGTLGTQMKTAVCDFIDVVAAMGGDYRIAVSQYSQSNSTNSFLDASTRAEELKNQTTNLKYYNENAGNIQNLLRVSNTLAGQSFDAMPKRALTVIFFTDGTPGKESYDPSYAAKSITIANAWKEKGAQVFAVNYAEDADPSVAVATPQTLSEAKNSYMNAISGNYPTSSCETNKSSFSAGCFSIDLGERAEGEFYKVADSNLSNLSAIFNEISEQIGGSFLELHEETVIMDEISEYFELDIEPDREILIHTESYKGNDEWEDDNNYNEYTYTLDGKKVFVTGFDYAENWVGMQKNGAQQTPHGKKIVLEIPIKDNGTGFGTVPTNTEDSGIYDGEDPVEPFPVPEDSFPYITIHHSADPENVEMIRIDTLDESFDPVEKTTPGYLYGGTFVDEEYTDAIERVNGKYIPKDGDKIYIWEVSDEHLMPKNLCAYKPVTYGTTKYDVTNVYLVTAVDRLNYKEVGFIIDDGEDTAVSAGENVAFAYLDVYQSDVYISSPKYIDLYPSAETTANSYISCYQFPGFKTSTQEAPFRFQAYWVTMDGIRVAGPVVRTAYYQGEGNTSLKVRDGVAGYGDGDLKGIVAPHEYQKAFESVSAPLKLMRTFSYENPIKVAQIPLASEEAADSVFVIEDGNTRTVEIADGAVALTPAEVEGKLFAGWFLDAACTEAADLNDVCDGMRIYAKYVADGYLKIKYDEKILAKRMTLVTAVDSKDFAETGFVIETNGKREIFACDSYSKTYSELDAGGLFAQGVDDKAPLMTYTYKLAGVKKNTEITITAYWVTKDGTTVYGQPSTLTYTGFSVKG